MNPIPSKADWLQAVALALGTALAEIGRIFDASPDADAAKQRVLDYLSGKFAPDVIAKLADGAPQEIVALFLTGVSTIDKPAADLG